MLPLTVFMDISEARPRPDGLWDIHCPPVGLIVMACQGKAKINALADAYRYLLKTFPDNLTKDYYFSKGNRGFSLN